MDRITRWTIILTILAGALFAQRALAADRAVTLVAPVGTVRVGDLVSVDVVVTNLSQAMNAVDVHLTYPTDRLSLVSISRSKSALTLWPQTPSWDTQRGTVTLIGGLPNGLYASDARVVTLTLTALQTGPAQISLDTTASALLLNDGQGTRVLLPESTLTLNVVSDLTPAIAVTSPSHPIVGQWYTNPNVIIQWPIESQTQYSYAWSGDGQLAPDTIPEKTDGTATFSNLDDGRYSFTIQSRPEGGSWSTVTQRWFLIDQTAPDPVTLTQLPPTTVGGNDVLTWTASDATSEVTSTLRIGRHDVGVVTSPLTLDHSWRGKTLQITVTDQAGNTQTGSWQYPGRSYDWRYWGGAIVGLVVLIVLALFVRRRR